MTSNKTTHDVAAQALQNIADGTPVEPAPFVMELMAAQHQEYQAIVGSHIQFLQDAIVERDAELAAIRRRINELFAGDYMPREEAVIMAVFYPSRRLIEQIKAEAKENES